MKASTQVIEERKRHHRALEELAASLGGAIKGKFDGLNLWRKLHRVEVQTHRACEAYCNGEIGEEGMNKACDRATDEVKRIFGGVLPPQFHVNRDPRGYALKLYASDNSCEPATKFQLHQDWGRNQILAPDID